MSYIYPLHQASSIDHAVFVPFVTEDPLLIVSKSSYLDFYSVNNGKFDLEYTFNINGIIRSLSSYCPDGWKTHVLVISTDKGQIFTVGFQNGEFVTIENLEITSPSNMKSDMGHLTSSDPKGRSMVINMYKGVLHYIRLKKTNIASSTSASKSSKALPNVTVNYLRLNELHPLNIAMLDEDLPTVAVLYKNNLQVANVSIYSVEYSTGNAAFLKPVPELSVSNVDSGATFILPIAKPNGGYIILGGSSITYIFIKEKELNVIKKPLPYDIKFVAWNAIDDNSARFLLSDSYGRVFLLGFNKSYSNWTLKLIGKSSFASSILHLSSGVCFVAGRGDKSQLFQIQQEKPYIYILDQLNNIGSIVDLHVIPKDHGTDLLVCSAGLRNGSYKYVRSGFAVKPIAEIDDITGIKYMWSLPKNILLVSTFHNTRVFEMNSESNEVEEIFSWHKIDLSQPTLGFFKLPSHQSNQSNFCIHVGNENIQKFSFDNEEMPSKIIKLNSILFSSFGTNTFVIAYDKNKLKYFDYDLTEINSIELSDQIACISLFDDSQVAVGFWTLDKVLLLSTADFSTVIEIPLFEMVPRSVLLTKFNGNSMKNLLIGLADGQLINYSIKDDKIESKSSLSIGIKPVLIYKTANLVFLVSNSLYLVYTRNGLVNYSPVNISTPNAITELLDDEAKHYITEEQVGKDSLQKNKSFIVFATEKKIDIGLLEKCVSQQVTSLEFDVMVRKASRIVHRYLSGLLTLSYPSDSVGSKLQDTTSTLQLIDEYSLSVINTYEFPEGEVASAICTIKLENNIDAFVIGTVYTKEKNELDGAAGRLVVLVISEKSDNGIEIKPLVSRNVSAPIYSIAALRDNIFISGYASSVHIHQVELKDINIEKKEEIGLLPNTSNSMMNETTLINKQGKKYVITKNKNIIQCQTVPVSLSVYKDIILIGDMNRSCTVCRYDFKKKTFEKLAKHLGPIWVTYSEIIDKYKMLVAEANGDLMVMTRSWGCENDSDDSEDYQGYQDVKKVKYESGRQNSSSRDINKNKLKAREKDDGLPVEIMKVTSAFYVGELINVIKRFHYERNYKSGKPTNFESTVDTTSEMDIDGNADITDFDQFQEPPVSIKAAAGTVQGSVYLYGEIHKKYVDLLLNLQNQLKNRCATLGNLSYDLYRGAQNSKVLGNKPITFVDGFLLERFFEFSHKDAEDILKKANITLTVENVYELINQIKIQRH